MLLALVAALASLVTAAFTLLVTGYFTARNERDKKLMEMHYRHLDEVSESLSNGRTDQRVDNLVFLHFPDTFESWQNFWGHRHNPAALAGDLEARDLLKELHAEVARSNEGMLLGAYSSARKNISALGILLGIVLTLQLLRIGYIARPDDGPPLKPLLFLFSEPFNYEHYLAKQLLALQDVQL